MPPVSLAPFGQVWASAATETRPLEWGHHESSIIRYRGACRPVIRRRGGQTAKAGSDSDTVNGAGARYTAWVLALTAGGLLFFAVTCIG